MCCVYVQWHFLDYWGNNIYLELPWLKFTYLNAPFARWEAPQAQHGRGRKGRRKDAWFWLRFVCGSPSCACALPWRLQRRWNVLLPSGFLLRAGDTSAEKCSEKIGPALFVMISVSWHLEHPNTIAAAVGCCTSSGSDLISALNFSVSLNKSYWALQFLRGSSNIPQPDNDKVRWD